MSFEHIEMDVEGEKVTYGDSGPESDYALVVFHDIAETYPTDSNITCTYTITSRLEPTTRDWVGIYKVGWSSPTNYTYYEWSPMSADYQAGSDIDSEIIFSAKNLPKDDGEFYQFCYVTNAGQVRGASTPFQFKRPGANEYVEIEDEESNMLVIQSKTVVLEQQLTKVQEEKTELEKMRTILETERDSLLDKLMGTSKKLTTEESKAHTLSKEIDELNEKILALNNDAKEMTMVHGGLTEQMGVVNKEKEEILKRLDENDSYCKNLQEKIKSMSNEKDALYGKHKMLEEEKELFKTHFTSSESTIQAYMKEIDNLKKQLAYLEDIRAKNTEEVMRLRDELEKERKKLKCQNSISNKDREHINSVTERLRNTEDKLCAAEHCKKLLNDEVTNIQEAHDEMAQSLERARSESHSLKSQVMKLEERQNKQETELSEEITSLKATLDGVQEEKERSLKELAETKDALMHQSSRAKSEQEGPMHALKIAQAHLERRLTKMKQKNSDAAKERDDLLKRHHDQSQLESDLHREIEDLKERLGMGAEEYKAKYIECKKYQTEVKKLRREMSQPNSPAVREVAVESPVERAAVQTNANENKKESSTQSESGEGLELSGSELQAQLEDLGQELEQRKMKKQKYKQLYSEEKEKREFMQRHYYEEVKKLREECERKDSEVDELKIECDNKVDALETLVVAQKAEIADLKRQLAEKMELPTPPALRPPQQLYPNPYVEVAQVTQPSPLKHPNPYTAIEITDDSSTLETAEYKERSQSTTSLDDDLPAAATSKLGQPLKPLPAPLAPEVLPSAKVAAVKALAGTGPVHPGDRIDLDLGPTEERPAFDDLDEFHDAEGEPLVPKICPTCLVSFQNCTQSIFEDHVQGHFITVCPMCQQEFDKDFPQAEFERHVQRHFEEEAADTPVDANL